MSISITIVGYGNVGRALTLLLLGSNYEMQLNILDPDDNKTGAFLDLMHAQKVQPRKRVSFNDFSLFEKSDYVFFTAGVPSKHGASRLTTLSQNLALVRNVFENRKLQPAMRIIAITNPVDVITAGILAVTQLPKEQVIGTGTYLDSMRFSYHLAALTGVDIVDVDALILGEHEDSCVPIISRSLYKQRLIAENDVFTKDVIQSAFDKTIHAAYEIRKTEPGTSIAVSHCALRILEQWMSVDPSVIPVSILLNDEYCKLLHLTQPICMSVPVNISSQGIQELPPIELTEDELLRLRNSAKILAQHQQF